MIDNSIYSSSDCQCNTCKYSRGEISFLKLLYLENEILKLYEDKVNNIKSGIGKTIRNENLDWCELDVIKINCEEMMIYLNSAYLNENDIEDNDLLIEMEKRAKKIIEKCNKRMEKDGKSR